MVCVVQTNGPRLSWRRGRSAIPDCKVRLDHLSSAAMKRRHHVLHRGVALCTLHFVVSFGLWIALLIVASCVLLNRSQYKTPTCQISITNVILCVCKSSWFHVSLICYNLFGKARIFSDWKWPPPNPHHGFLWQSLVLCTHMISHLMHSPGFQKSGPLKVLLNFNSVDKLRSEWYQRLSLSHISTDSNELRGQKVQLWAQKTDICCSWIYNWWPSLL